MQDMFWIPSNQIVWMETQEKDDSATEKNTVKMDVHCLVIQKQSKSVLMLFMCCYYTAWY